MGSLVVRLVKSEALHAEPPQIYGFYGFGRRDSKGDMQDPQPRPPSNLQATNPAGRWYEQAWHLR